MAGSNKVVLKFLADVDGINRGVQDVNSKLSSLGKAAKVVGGILAGAFVADKILDFAAASVKAAQESDIATNRINQIAESMGYTQGQYEGATARIEEYASALSRQIGVEDESIKAVQAKLLTFSNIGDTVDRAGGSFDRATQAAYDLASAGFGQAENNAVQLGKALQDPIKGITALARSGVSFTAVEKEKIKTLVEGGKILEAQDMVLSAIEKQVGGTAAATVTGAQKMQVAWGELQETVGAGLGPAVTEIANALAPAIDSLAVPLGEVAKTIGGALSEAFTALKPILPVLADALGKIAAVLGDALVTAIKVLTPIITPMVEAFGKIATRIGPILQPILEKIGALLGKVFEALEPLIEPMTDLVFTILEAAMPILDIVADLLLSLVDAFKPMFKAVSVLIKPLTVLIEGLLEALMPILKPLLPVFKLLAGILGEVLVRSIGYLTGAIGGMILGFSKVAPFVLNNLTKPVVEAFFKMADNVLTAAETMLSWVPGLGDTLASARGEFDKFKTGALDGISAAADTIAKEGEKTGKELLNSAGKAITDPASLSKLETKTEKAANQVGVSFGSGLVSGMASQTRAVQAEAARLTAAAEAAARRATQSRSPSKTWQALGNDLGEGLELGLSASQQDLQTAVKALFASLGSTKASNDLATNLIATWAQVGDSATEALLTAAQRKVQTESAAIKAWISERLSTDVTVRIRYEEINGAPSLVRTGAGVIDSIRAYETYNGSSWRV